ncbi:hypothetical protein MTO96_001847 [Rhipicephalus appendiculatus]
MVPHCHQAPRRSSRHECLRRDLVEDQDKQIILLPGACVRRNGMIVDVSRTSLLPSPTRPSHHAARRLCSSQRHDVKKTCIDVYNNAAVLTVVEQLSLPRQPAPVGAAPSVVAEWLQSRWDCRYRSPGPVEHPDRNRQASNRKATGLRNAK